MRAAQSGNGVPNLISVIARIYMGNRQKWFQTATRDAKMSCLTGAEGRQVPEGSWWPYEKFMSMRRSDYWSGGFFSEPGLTDRIQAMTFHKSSDVLMIPPKGGMGPTTVSLLTRL